jgi:hypothetical protein
VQRALQTGPDDGAPYPLFIARRYRRVETAVTLHLCTVPILDATQPISTNPLLPDGPADSDTGSSWGAIVSAFDILQTGNGREAKDVQLYDL